MAKNRKDGSTIRRQGIRFIGFTKNQIGRITGMIKRNFSESERRTMRGLKIESKQLEAGLAGTWRAKNGQSSIELSKSYPTDRKPAILVHELTHHLRRFDKRRKGVLREFPETPADLDIDEAMTEAETIARYNPYHWSDVNEPNYWDRTREARQSKTAFSNQKATSKAMFKDRKRFTEQPRARHHIQLQNTGKFGEDAPQSARKHFAGSEISTLIDEGKNEAIDRYFEHTNRRGNKRIHVRSQPGSKVLRHIRKMVGWKGSLFEWKDGRKYRVKRTRRRTTRKRRGRGWYGESKRHSIAAKKGWKTRIKNRKNKIRGNYRPRYRSVKLNKKKRKSSRDFHRYNRSILSRPRPSRKKLGRSKSRRIKSSKFGR